MVFYISSLTYREVIHRTVTEQDLVIAGAECNNEMYLLKYFQENMNKLGNIDQMIVDLNALQDTDEETLQAFDMLRYMHFKTRIIIVASSRQPGEEFLKNLFDMGIYDIILSDVFADIYEELKYCLNTGKQYKDAIVYKDLGTGQKNQVVVKKEIKRTVNKILVGVTGSQHRIGCTHASIVLANYLREKGYMVALLEYGQQEVFAQIREAYEENLVEDRYFSLNGVDCYGGVSEQEFLQLLSNKFYNFLIVDFGTYADCDRMMFSRCDLRLLIVGAKPWELAHIHQIFETTDLETLKQLHFIFNFISGEQYGDIRKEMEELDQVYFLPLTEDPFESKQRIGELEKIFAFYESQNNQPKKKKRRSFLEMLRRK